MPSPHTWKNLISFPFHLNKTNEKSREPVLTRQQMKTNAENTVDHILLGVGNRSANQSHSLTVISKYKFIHQNESLNQEVD